MVIVRKKGSIVSPSAQKSIDNFPPPLLLSVPYERWTRGSENWVSAFSEFDHHQFSDFVTFSFWSVNVSRTPPCLWSRSEEWPSSWWKSFRINRNEIGALFAFLHIFFRSPWDVVEHRHEDNPSCEIFWFYAHIRQELLDFDPELQLSESWENSPLEFHRLTINCVQSSVWWWNSWTKSTCPPRQYWMLGSDSPFQDITQSEIDWWLLHHWPKINVSMKNLPSWFESLQKSHLIIRLSTFQICQTPVSKWDCSLCFWWNVNFLSISFTWIQMLPMLKT